MKWDVIIHSPYENSQGFDPMEQRGTIAVKGQVGDVFYGAWTVVSHVFWDKVNHQEIADVLINHITDSEGNPKEVHKLHESVTPPQLYLVNTDGHLEVQQEFAA